MILIFCISFSSLPHSAELDREHKALIEAKQRGLGLMGTWESEENWYGGKVQQIVHLRFNADPKDGLYSFKLGKLEYGRSNRITRFLGSVSVLQVRIAKDVYSKKKGNDLIDFLSRRHVLCGRVYVPFYAKENKIYLVETNEDFGRLPVSALGDHLRVSWSSFVDRNNPLELNKNQVRSFLLISESYPHSQFSRFPNGQLDGHWACLRQLRC